MQEAIERFHIHVEDAVLADLKERLARTRYPDQIPDTGWDYGIPVDRVRDLCEYWRERFDWRERERELNRLPHYRTVIDNQQIHFVHVRSPHESALPLLIVHGWPGSFVEFLGIVDALTHPERHGGDATDAFHLVIPSLPGYAFSGPTRERQWDAPRIAGAFAELMRRLDYTRYGAQGGDWGAVITTELAFLDRERLCGLHLNMPLALPREDRSGLSERELADLADMEHFERMETGYQKIQGTKPQTLGVALNDSPAGLAAWITEKFRTWSDCGGDYETVFTKDQILTNITIYWVTRTITSSMRLYYEVFQGGRMSWLSGKVEVPTGVARFPKELMKFPRKWVEQHYNVTHWTDMPRGGHFAAMEQPELFVRDVREFFRGLR